MTNEAISPLTIFGRSSSHFTRVVRIFAAELHVDYAYSVARDLMSLDAADYGGNPALKLPALKTPEGTWYGALNVCRELARRTRSPLRIIWPEDLTTSVLANAQELSVQAMSTEVGLIMSKAGAPDESAANLVKMRKSLSGSLTWLDAHVDEVLALLPADRQVSFLEVTLYCLVKHLEFRQV